MSIASEITRLQGAIANLKTAIEAKGVTVGDITLDGYAAKVAEIPTGGGNPPETPTDSLLFYSPNEIRLSVYNKTKNWNGALYYSTDHETWTTWNGQTEISSALSNGFHKLYLRGAGNSYITGNSARSNGRFIISGQGIVCVGDLINLFDYAYPPSYIGQQYALAWLFQNCGNIEFDLTMTAPAQSWYALSHTFENCVAMKKILKTNYQATMGRETYSYMYIGCISLEQLPSFQSESFANSSLISMFNGCTHIKLSTEQTGEYQTEYRIPVSGTATNTGSTDNMFANTGGTFTGTPTINTTYYTSNTVIPAI